MPRTSASAAPGPPTSSSSNKFSSRPPARPASSGSDIPWPAHPASNGSDVPWPHQMCRKMPWRCRCRPCAEGTDEEHFRIASCNAGVWETAEQDQVEANKHQDCDLSPVPDKESALWVCLMQKFRAELGDWFCTECNNHNKGFLKVCNWSACETRDWRCSCGNLNRSNCVVCNRRDPPCFQRRPHCYY